MSHFAVTIETISEIQAHTNADRLEMARLSGKDYEFVVLKDQFQVGDAVVYFPVDSLLPEWVTDALHLTGKLAGGAKNRVKTIKLRGNISQGIVAFPAFFSDHAPEMKTVQPGDDVTALLGVEKYEAPPILFQHGTLLPLPPFVWKYDIEGAQNYVALVEQLLDERVYITEKLEGSHWSVTWLAADERIIVSQRNFRIESEPDSPHAWHKMAREGDYAAKLRQIADEQGRRPQAITLRGEIVGPGIQANYYKLKQHRIYLFEAEIDGQPIAAGDFLVWLERYALPGVPVLAQDVTLREWLDGRTVKEAADGRSVIADKAREGIVIKPMSEQRHDSLGRVFLKQRGPKYLAKSDF
ncbi:MAG: RNA ligase (ATP) [Aggregatilineales bacterium]